MSPLDYILKSTWSGVAIQSLRVVRTALPANVGQGSVQSGGRERPLGVKTFVVYVSPLETTQRDNS